MANLPPDLAESIANAKVAGGGDYIQYGEYVAMIHEWKFQKIQDRCVILEVMLVESKKKVVYEGDKKVEVDPNAPGSLASSVANFDGDAKLVADSNSQAPVLGLFGLPSGHDKNVIKKTLKQVLKMEEDGDPDLAGVPIQPARGMLIGVDGYPKEIRSRKGEYITGLNWHCVNVPGQGVNAPDKVAARVAALRVSREEALKVALEHLAAARAAGVLHVAGAPTSAAASSAAAPSLASSAASTPSNGSGVTAAVTAAAGNGAPPPIPGSGAPPPIPTPADPIAAGGWKPHPSDSSGTWYYKDGYPRTVKKDDILAGRV